MTLSLAQRGLEAAQAKAKALGTPMTVSVVDDAGRIVLIGRGDGTGFFTPNTSLAKAVAAAAFKRSTKEMGELRAKGSSFWESVTSVIPGQILPSIGGVPVIVGQQTIGAVGCGGGTGEQDHECAVAAADAMAGEGPGRSR
jgi:glc operon protein GlcG